MAVSLVKGGNVSLTKEAPSMNVALVGLGWDARVTDGQAFDLDASVFLVGDDGKVLSDSHFVFYNNTTSPDGAVQRPVAGEDGVRAGGEDRFERFGPDFQRRLRAGFLALAAEFPGRCRVIPAAGSPDEIAARLAAEVGA